MLNADLLTKQQLMKRFEDKTTGTLHSLDSL